MRTTDKIFNQNEIKPIHFCLHLASVPNSIRLPTRVLEALDEGNVDLLP